MRVGAHAHGRVGMFGDQRRHCTDGVGVVGDGGTKAGVAVVRRKLLQPRRRTARS